jgi:glucose dehydrogenase
MIATMVASLMPAIAQSDDPAQWDHYGGSQHGMRRAVVDSPLDVPCTAPPWGVLTANDMRKGVINWQTSVGSISSYYVLETKFEL